MRRRSRDIAPPEATNEPQLPEISLEQAALIFFGRPRHLLIAEAAYYRSQRGNRDPVADWIESETEIDRLLRARLDRGAVESE